MKPFQETIWHAARFDKSLTNSSTNKTNKKQDVGETCFTPTFTFIIVDPIMNCINRYILKQMDQG